MHDLSKRVVNNSIVVFASFVFVFVSVAAIADSNPVEDLLHQGKLHYRDGHYDDAIAAWNAVLQQDPGNLQATRYIQRATSRVEEIQQAAVMIPKEGPKTSAPKFAEVIPEPFVAPMTPPPMAPEVVVETPYADVDQLETSALTLQDCVTIALSNHRPARIALEEVLVARMKVTEAKRGLFPIASLKNEEIEGRAVQTGQVALTDFRGREITLELQQPIFQGGRLLNTLRQAQVNLAVAVKNYDKLKDDFIFEVEQAYFVFANAKNVRRNLGELQVKGREAAESVDELKKIGVARDVDVLSVRSQAGDIDFQVATAANDLELAKLTLGQLLGLGEESEFDIVSPPVLKKADYENLNIQLEECKQLAYQSRSDLYIRELMVEYQRYGVEIAKSKSRLKVDLTGSYGLNREAFQTAKLDLQEEFFIGLKGSLPLGPHTLEENFINQDKAASAGQTTSNAFESISSTLKFFDNFNSLSVTEAQIAYHKALDELHKMQKTLDFEVKKAFFDYRKAVMNLGGYQTKQRLGTEELKIAESQYDLNQVQLSNLLQSRVKNVEYKNGYGKAATDYYSSVANLNKTVGISGYFDAIGGKREPSLVDSQLSRRPLFARKDRLSNYQAEISRAEKIVQSIKPEDRWWEIFEKDETSHADIKDRWWETWEKDTQTGVVRPKSQWWRPWHRGTPTAPRARKKWWQMWEQEDSISDTPYEKAGERDFMPKPEDLVTRDMVRQLFQGGKN